MNSRARLAIGVGIGYLLGRTRKMRLALMVAGATGAAGTPRQLVRRGLTQLASTPEVGRLTTVAGRQLVDAAKSAAIMAASSRIDALNEKLQGRSDDTSESSSDDEDRDVAESAGDAEEEKPRRSRRTARGRSGTDESGDKPARSSARRGTRAPVRRSGR